MNKKVISKITSGVLLCTMLAYTTPVLAFTKDETVYSKIDSNGNNYNTIVNDHIINDEQEQLINDISDLLNIKNVNGDEEFSQDGNNLAWHAEESDIYYQGESQKELPIECNVKYELDGNEITASELVGKNGKVKITIEYINKDAHTVNINGKDQTLYTPFVVVCGTIIDNNNNRNIEITNGKTVDDGSKTTVIGISLPGLQESLNISKDKIDIPNTIEITMDSTDFELNNIVTYVTPKVLEENDMELFKKLDKIYNQVDTLQSSSKQIEEGANSLKEGTATYSEKSQEFNNAVEQVSKGVSSVNQNYSKIDAGISSLNDSSATLESGAKSVSEGTLAVSENLQTISSKLTELQTGTQSLKQGEIQLEAGLDQIITSVSTIQGTDNSAKITELNQLITANQNTINSLKTANETLTTQLKAIEDEETKQTITTQIETNKSIIKLLETNIVAYNETISTLKSADMSSIKELQTALSNLKQGLQSLQTGTDTLYNGTTALQTGTGALASKTKELAQGTQSLYEGTIKISEGTATLNSGSTQLKQGLNTLDAGGTKLGTASNQLTEGANTLSEGATTLAEGITKFNEEGIDKICDYINGDLKDISARLEKLQELSEDYNNFTMLNDGNKGNVKFIMIMDSIKKEEDSKQDIILDDKQK